MLSLSHAVLSRRLAFGLLASVALPARAFAGTPQSGGTLVVAAEGEQRSFNPAIIASNAVFYIGAKILEPLYEMGSGGALTPRLAIGHQASTDGMSLTFRLRDNVKWHDGQPFSSADVAFSAMEVWKKVQNIGRGLLTHLDSVETPDRLTAIFRFARPVPPDLILNALPAISTVVPKHLYAGTDVMTNPANMKPVGTGPFRFFSHQPNVEVKLVRNEHYWDKDQPYLGAIVYKSIPDRSTIAAALETGQIHLAAFSAVPLTDLARLGKVPGLTVIRNGYDGITYQMTVEINHRRKELADVRVRRAIAHAIDRDFVARTIFLGSARPASGPVPAIDSRFFDPSLKPPAYDRKLADKLLDEAGYPRGANKMRFALRLLPAPWFEQTKQFGAYLRQALRAIGIDVQIIANDPAAHIRAVYTDAAFDLAIGSPVYRNDPAISTTMLYRGGQPAGVPFSNQYGYASPAMDALIDKGVQTLDRAGRVKVYHAFQQLAQAELPLIPVVEFTFVTVARNTVRNVATNPRWATSHWADCWLSPA